MKVTIPYIEKKFDEFNEQMFDGKLPKLPIELSNAKSFLGVCASQKRRLLNGKTVQNNFRLRFSSRIDLPEQVVEDTIIHEMIHYYIGINQLKDTAPHGTLFQCLMNHINEKFGRHLTISHKLTTEQKEQTYDTRRRWQVIAIVTFTNGKTGVKVLPRILRKIANYYNSVGTYSKVSDIKLYMSNDSFFNRFPKSAALNAVYAEREEVLPHLAEAEVIECDGKTLILNGKRYELETDQSKSNAPRYHVVAFMRFSDGGIGFKVLPKTLLSLQRYYNTVKIQSSVRSIELFMSNDPYFERFPKSGSLKYHKADESELLEHLKGAKRVEI